MLKTWRMKQLSAKRYADACEQAERSGGQVCGVYREDGSADYFVVSADASDAAVREAAFERRAGRPMTSTERVLLGMVEARRK